MLALEHRYYGPSNPYGDYSTANFKYFNTEQALGDIASFHAFITEVLLFFLLFNSSLVYKFVITLIGLLDTIITIVYLTFLCVASSFPY